MPAVNPAELEQFLVSFVVEQTGYPAEMVDLDADLEADLGIDSIKKAQLFGELAQHLDVQVEINENMSLDDFPTLRHVMNAMLTAAASGAAPASASASATAAPAPAAPSTPAPVPAAPAAVRPATPVRPAAPPTPARPAAPPVPARPAAPPTLAAPARPAAPVAPPRPASPAVVSRPAAPAAPAVPVRPAAPARPATPVAAKSPAAPASPAPASNGPAVVKTSAGKELSLAELEAFLVNFVVEQTGYPAEMVDLDADLEADLGIDSIKKAQLFGELAQNLDVQITIDENLSLDSFPTLRHVLDFMRQAMAAPAG
jgi:acyl carrier protein